MLIPSNDWIEKEKYQCILIERKKWQSILKKLLKDSPWYIKFWIKKWLDKNIGDLLDAD